jgi:hypothetical protein
MLQVDSFWRTVKSGYLYNLLWWVYNYHKICCHMFVPKVNDGK